ncbi:MAG: hypothetical protein LQ338_005977 [Usnochroma carphineum]|nr:MAG: hypothetical protein LQ338_005977 [Usnochroma carphineum]
MPHKPPKLKHPTQNFEQSSKSPSTTASRIDLQLQQSLLTTFTVAFASRFDDKLQSAIQTVKGHLYARDFDKAFADQAGLEAYAVRWSPSRALAYLELFCSLPRLRDALLQTRQADGEGKSGRRKTKVVCLGGGAGAEIVALAGWLRCLQNRHVHAQAEEEMEEEERIGIEVLAVDIAPWNTPIQKLYSSLTTPPPLSPYASAAIKAASRPLVHQEDYLAGFRQRDVLAMGEEELRELCEDVGMVTLMFTLNELYSVSISRTTNLLLQLTNTVAKGVILLVVDSPGSYSVVGLTRGAKEMKDQEGKNTVKKYPMQWLLDHTLLEAAKEGKGDGKGVRQWEKMHEEQSRWFRLEEGLKYPIALEDMRMQISVYRRL